MRRYGSASANGSPPAAAQFQSSVAEPAASRAELAELRAALDDLRATCREQAVMIDTLKAGNAIMRRTASGLKADMAHLHADEATSAPSVGRSVRSSRRFAAWRRAWRSEERS